MATVNVHLRQLTSDAWQRCERAVQEYEGAWQRGARPPLDDFLPDTETLRQAVLVELVCTELELRLDAGEPVRVESYLERFPDLAGDHSSWD
jgi:hypothetical protein